MSPPAAKTLAQLAEINSLNIRLATAKSNRARQLEAINRLKTLQANGYANICRFDDEIDRKNRESQLAYSMSQWKEYGQKCEELSNIESQKSRAMRDWTEMENQIQRSSGELAVLDHEILELERLLNARNSI